MLSPSSLRSWGGGPSPCESSLPNCRYGLNEDGQRCAEQQTAFGQRQRGDHLCKSRSGGVGHLKDAAETPPQQSVTRGLTVRKKKFDLAAAQKRRSQAACKSSTAGIRSNNWACTPNSGAQDDDALLLIRKTPVAPPHDGIRGHPGLQPGPCRRFQSFSIPTLVLPWWMMMMCAWKNNSCCRMECTSPTWAGRHTTYRSSKYAKRSSPASKLSDTASTATGLSCFPCSLPSCGMCRTSPVSSSHKSVDGHGKCGRMATTGNQQQGRAALASLHCEKPNRKRRCRQLPHVRPHCLHVCDTFTPCFRLQSVLMG